MSGLARCLCLPIRIGCHDDASPNFSLSGLNPTKLLSFATYFSRMNQEPHVLCYSVTAGKQTINTHLGCILEIEQSSASSTFLLYVEVRPPQCLYLYTIADQVQ